MDEERLRSEYIAFAKFIGLPIAKNATPLPATVSQTASSNFPAFGSSANFPSHHINNMSASSSSSAQISPATAQLLWCRQDAHQNASIMNRIPIALIKMVVDDVKMKLFKTYGEGACEHLLRFGALPPINANPTAMIQRESTPPPQNLLCVVGGKRPRRDEDLATDTSERSQTSHQHPLVADGGYRGPMTTASHRRLSGNEDPVGPCFLSTAPNVSVKADEMLSPNSTIQRMLQKQEAAKHNAVAKHDDSISACPSTPLLGVASSQGVARNDSNVLSLARALKATPRPAPYASVATTVINSKFPHHMFCSKLLTREEVCRVLNHPLPDPIVVTENVGCSDETVSKTSSRLTMPTSLHNTAVSLFSISEHLHRLPLCEADRLMFLKEQEELLADAIEVAKHKNEELERDVFIYKDKCERMTKVWKAEMSKEESALKSYEMNILESRRKIDKTRMELKRSQLEEERLSKIIKNSKAK